MKKNDQNLPSKEASTFKTVLKLYDSKQYKKAIKLAESILKKFPENGETMCMKGLAIYHMFDQKASKDEVKKAEGFEMVKLGLRKNIRSYVCWHVFGIIQRAKGNHHEAIKAYKSALRIQPNNVQILRDTALLQMRVRDVEGLIKTRHQLLSLQGTVKSNWVGFCIAHFLAKHYQMTEAIVDSYLTTLGSNKKQDVTLKYTKSEAIIFKAKIFLESEQYDKCLELLESEPAVSEITDVIFLKETTAMLYLRSKQYEAARSMYLQLMNRNMDNLLYHFGYIAAFAKLVSVSSLQEKGVSEFDVFTVSKFLSEEVKAELTGFYEQKKQLPENTKNWTLDVILLCLLEAKKFEDLAEAILRRNLSKGVPKLFDFFKYFYLFSEKADNAGVVLEEDVAQSLKQSAESKISILSTIVTKLVSSLEKNRKFNQSDSETQTPDVLIWAKFFQAQQQFYSGDTDKALDCLNALIADVPTLLPLYILRAEILTSLGNHIDAAFCLNLARKIDLQDRYINTVCAQNLIRCNLVDDYLSAISVDSKNFQQLLSDKDCAQDVVALFAKHDGDARTNLFEMQVIWYSQGVALSAQRLLAAKVSMGSSKDDVVRYLALALKYNQELLTYFEAFEEDQTDFHSYCLRKGGLSCYADFLEHLQSLKHAKPFVLALSRIMTLLYFIKNNSELFKTKEDSIKDLEQQLKGEVTTDEKKKIKQQIHQIKKQIKKEKEQVAAKTTAVKSTQRKSRRRRQIKADPDPHGVIAFEVTRTSIDDELAKVTSLLELSSPGSIDATMVLAIESLRKSKPLRAIKLLKRATHQQRCSALKPDIFYVAILVLAVTSKQTVQHFSVGKKSASFSWSGDEKVRSLAQEAVKDILGTSLDVKQSIEAYEKKASCQDQLFKTNILLAKRSCMLVDNKFVANDIEASIKGKKISASETFKLLQLLTSIDLPTEDFSRISTIAKETFPLSTDLLFFKLEK